MKQETTGKADGKTGLPLERQRKRRFSRQAIGKEAKKEETRAATSRGKTKV